MQSGKTLIKIGLLAVMLLLSACGPSPESLTPTVDVTLVYTQAAQTVAAQFTQTSAAQTASAPTPTNTPEPTFTPAPTFTPLPTLPLLTLSAGGTTPQALPIFTPTLSLLPLPATVTGVPCNDSVYLEDVGTVDGTTLKPGQEFTKGWRIQNTGTCKWDIGYRLIRVGGNTDFGGDTFVIRKADDIVLPGKIAVITLHLTAPKQPGTYEARYQMYTNLDVPFGTGMTVAVLVKK